jgi:hypothetical protein
MAKKVFKREQTCKDCKYSHSPHCKNSKGEMFLCKCPFHAWSKFLNYSYCENFEER